MCTVHRHEHTKYQNYDESPCFQIEMALNPNFNQIGQAFIQQVDLDLHVNISCRIQWSILTSILMTYKTIHRSCLFPTLFKSKLFLLCVSVLCNLCVLCFSIMQCSTTMLQGESWQSFTMRSRLEYF